MYEVCSERFYSLKTYVIIEKLIVTTLWITPIAGFASMFSNFYRQRNSLASLIAPITSLSFYHFSGNVTSTFSCQNSLQNRTTSSFQFLHILGKKQIDSQCF